MKYAEVAVDSPRCHQPLSYSVPENITPRVGFGVWVPFGKRILCGLIVEVSDQPRFEPVRDIVALSHPQSMLSQEQIDFGCWLGQHYFTSLFSALSLLLPPGWLSRIRNLASQPLFFRSLSAQELIAKFGYEEKPPYPSPPPVPPLPSLSPDMPLTELWQSLSQVSRREKSQKGVFLVQGEGRQLLYHHLLAQAVASGRRCLVLSPEEDSALHRSCVQAFPGRCLGFHGKLTLRRRLAAWQAVEAGAADIVLGSRSTLFAPLAPLGLIILDEEQDDSYKEEKTSPFYHAREVALRLAELKGAVVVLGSATPDVESYYRCQQEEFNLIRLPPTSERQGVELVNMRQELRQGQRSPFSRALIRGLTQTLAEAGQALLFINCRGQASFVQCEHCGAALRCPRCALFLTSHGEADLFCHHCGYKEPLPQKCPRCQGGELKLRGAEAGGIENEVHRLFPQARLGLWEEKGLRKQRQLLNQWRDRQIDILIGSPVVAQGPNPPQADLVGIIAGDYGLFIPDFRSGERTYHLLTKLISRRRRGGRAIIQAYLPEHYALQSAAKQDYAAFYQAEIGHRRRFGYPPFSRLARLLVLDANPHRGEQRAQRLIARIEEQRQLLDLSLRILGPTPAYQPWLKGRHRWQIILMGRDIEKLLTTELLPRGVSVELDPVELT